MDFVNIIERTRREGRQEGGQEGRVAVCVSPQQFRTWLAQVATTENTLVTLE